MALVLDHRSMLLEIEMRPRFNLFNRRRVAFHVAMHKKIVDAAQDNNCEAEPKRDMTKLQVHQLLVLAHFDSHVAEDGTPNAGADHGEQRKHAVMHSHD